MVGTERDDGFDQRYASIARSHAEICNIITEIRYLESVLSSVTPHPSSHRLASGLRASPIDRH